MLLHLWHTFSGSHIIAFVCLFVCTQFIYSHYFKRTPVVLTSSYIVMAIAIISIFCLSNLLIPPFVRVMIALELLSLWIVFGLALIQIDMLGDKVLKTWDDEIKFGSWVIATVLTALLLNQAEKTLHGFIVMLGMTAFILYVSYMILIVQYIIRHKGQKLISSAIFLLPLSTASIVLLLAQLFLHHLPLYFLQGLLIFAMLLYGLAAGVLLSQVRNYKIQNYGAMSAIGLGCVATQAFSNSFTVTVWWSAAILLFLILLTDIWLLLKCLFDHQSVTRLMDHANQWLQLFTFGMFYAFTLSYYNHQYSTNELVVMIATKGQYVVTSLLVLQILFAFLRHYQKGDQ